MRQFINAVVALYEDVHPLDGDVEGISQLGPIKYDQVHGLGAVGDSTNIKYLGFATFMKPSMFLNLATTRGTPFSDIEDKIAEGTPIGSPFLDISFRGSVAQVRSHEGRGRMMAIRSLYGDIPVLVHCFAAGGDRARHLSLPKINGFRLVAIKEKSTTIQDGPNCSKQVWWNTGWHNLV